MPLARSVPDLRREISRPSAGKTSATKKCCIHTPKACGNPLPPRLIARLSAVEVALVAGFQTYLPSLSRRLDPNITLRYIDINPSVCCRRCKLLTIGTGGNSSTRIDAGSSHSPLDFFRCPPRWKASYLCRSRSRRFGICTGRIHVNHFQNSTSGRRSYLIPPMDYYCSVEQPRQIKAMAVSDEGLPPM